MEQGIREGCQTFDQALLVLYQAGKITIAEALANADSANNLRLKIKMAGLVADDVAEGNIQSNTEHSSEPKADVLGTSNVFRLQGR